MGNCSLKGDSPSVIRILSDSGDIIELKSPNLVKDVINMYPGYAIFRQGEELANYEYLIRGQLYHLLPKQKNMSPISCGSMDPISQVKKRVKEESPKVSNGAALQVLPSRGDGIWRVKMAIKTDQLKEILSEEMNTEALIENIRIAARCSRYAPRRTSKNTCGVARKLAP